MQESFGFPLISHEQLPHFPALQFQRTARSLANFAWLRCTASSPPWRASDSIWYSTKSPPSALPRQTLNFRIFGAVAVSGMETLACTGLRGRRLGNLGLEVLDRAVRDPHELRRPRWLRHLVGHHLPVGSLVRDEVHGDPLVALA